MVEKDDPKKDERGRRKVRESSKQKSRHTGPRGEGPEDLGVDWHDEKTEHNISILALKSLRSGKKRRRGGHAFKIENSRGVVC